MRLVVVTTVARSSGLLYTCHFIDFATAADADVTTDSTVKLRHLLRAKNIRLFAYRIETAEVGTAVFFERIGNFTLYCIRTGSRYILFINQSMMKVS